MRAEFLQPGELPSYEDLESLAAKRRDEVSLKLSATIMGHEVLKNKTFVPADVNESIGQYSSKITRALYGLESPETLGVVKRSHIFSMMLGHELASGSTIVTINDLPVTLETYDDLVQYLTEAPQTYLQSRPNLTALIDDYSVDLCPRQQIIYADSMWIAAGLGLLQVEQAHLDEHLRVTMPAMQAAVEGLDDFDWDADLKNL